MRARTFTLLLGVAALVGCQPSFGGGPGTIATPANPTNATPGGALGLEVNNGFQPFLTLMPDAPEKTAFEGVRTVWMDYDFRGTVSELRYSERVRSDGRGRFAIDPVAGERPTMTPPDEEAFTILQKSRESFFFRYRDFRVHDLPVFFQNYELVYLPTDTQVAGVRCVQLEIRRREDADRYYVVAVDPSTGLVLRFDERTLDSRAIGGMAFDSIELAPDLGTAELTEGAFDPRELNIDESLADQVSFDPIVPNAPTGYQLYSAHAIEVPDPTVSGGPLTEWVRYVYSDGLEKVFFLTRERIVADEPAGSGSAPTRVASQRATDRVRVSTVGPWTLVDGSVGSWRVIAMGKVAKERLLQMVQSGLE